MSSRDPLLLLLLCASLSAPSCTKRVETEAPVEGGEPAAVTGSEGPAPVTVTLLEPGEEPRTTLRYRLEVGQEEDSIVTTAMSMGISMGEGMDMQMPVPTYDMTMHTRVDEITAEGDLVIEYTITDVSVVATEETALMASTLEAELEKTVGIQGVAVMSPSGRIKSYRVSDYAQASAEMQQSLSTIEQSVQNSAIPFPDEAVGVGARWSAATSVTTNGFSIQQESIYTVTAIHEDGAEIGITLTQTAPEQDIPAPGGAAIVHLNTLRGEAVGRFVHDADAIMPTMELVLDMKMDMSTLVEGNAMDSSAVMKIETRSRRAE